MNKTGLDLYIDRQVFEERYQHDLAKFLREQGLDWNSNFARWTIEAISVATRRGVGRLGMDIVLGIALVRAYEQSYVPSDTAVSDLELPLDLNDEADRKFPSGAVTADLHIVATWLNNHYRTGLFWRSRPKHTIEKYEQLLTDLNEDWDLLI